jgi:hypothetical protein
VKLERPAAACKRRRPASALVCAISLLALLTACAPAEIRTVLENREGIEISLRAERHPPRPAPGAEFQDLDETKLARSLRRVVVRYGKVISFYRSDPVPLFTPEQVGMLSAVLLRELPALPADKRIGLAFLDQYRGDLVDIELYPEGEYLVYNFRALMVLKDDRQRNRVGGSLNYGVLLPQRDQIVEDKRYPLLKDPLGSAARPDFKLRDSDKPEQESPL